MKMAEIAFTTPSEYFTTVDVNQLRTFLIKECSDILNMLKSKQLVLVQFDDHQTVVIDEEYSISVTKKEINNRNKEKKTKKIFHTKDKRNRLINSLSPTGNIIFLVF